MKIKDLNKNLGQIKWLNLPVLNCHINSLYLTYSMQNIMNIFLFKNLQQNNLKLFHVQKIQNLLYQFKNIKIKKQLYLVMKNYYIYHK